MEGDIYFTSLLDEGFGGCEEELEKIFDETVEEV